MANNIYGAIALIGGAAGALDAIDGAGLADKDIAIVFVQNVGTYIYNLVAASAATESSPSVISPDANAGNKRWILQNVNGVNLYPNTISGTPTTLSAVLCSGFIHYVSNAAATQVNLPPVSGVPTGAIVIIYMQTAYVLTINPDDVDRIRLNGVNQSDGVTIVSGGAVGNYVTLQNDSVDGWTVVGRSGSWAQGA